ncbi:NAD(P)-dependent alcohol dehydrogenase [Cryobacterium sinapicolor]|uniref:NAD(P)-dependent alcohol dehydrogenase n=1 Tax=Cryobacterium sinapicolor TaxID=1259236 RepID=UPI0018E0AD94|nr:NAD(P)-dependent alcohol dehydrogenase [Cryobacterium sinapicolor]
MPKPVPGANEVRVRNSASVVTAAMCEARAGSPMARLYFGLRKPKWPILGTNFSGEVQAVGRSVTNFRVGALVAGVSVTNFGAYAEYIVVPEDGVIAAKPSNLSDEEAVAVFDGSITALPFLRDAANLRPGQSVLINGASGAVGTAAIQLAKHYGAIVTAVCSSANRTLVASLGAEHVIGYVTQDFTDNHDTYDVIFDAVARSSFMRSRRALKQGGIYLTTVPSLAILLQMLWTSKMGRKKAAVVFTGLAKPAQIVKNLVFIGKLAEAGRFLPVIGSTHAMGDAAHAHRQVESGHKRGSAVLTIAAEQ